MRNPHLHGGDCHAIDILESFGPACTMSFLPARSGFHEAPLEDGASGGM